MLLLTGIGMSAHDLIPKDATNSFRLRNELLNVIRTNETGTFLEIFLKFNEKSHHCCGVNGPADYGANELPKTCCIQPDDFVCEKDLPPCYLVNAYQTGCWEHIYESSRDEKNAPFKLDLGVLVAQCLAVLQTLTIFKMDNQLFCD